MICKKCSSDNLMKANYCRSCGNPFTQEEKDAARKKSLVGVLETADEVKDKADKIGDILSMKFITDNIFVRIALIVLPFLLTVLISGGGKDMRILDSDRYSIYYNTTTEEYFVDTEYGSVDLQLYLPENTWAVDVSFGTAENNSQVGLYETTAAIVLNARSGGCYIITAIDENRAVVDSIVVYTV